MLKYTFENLLVNNLNKIIKFNRKSGWKLLLVVILPVRIRYQVESLQIIRFLGKKSNSVLNLLTKIILFVAVLLWVIWYGLVDANYMFQLLLLK